MRTWPSDTGLVVIEIFDSTFLNYIITEFFLSLLWGLLLFFYGIFSCSSVYRNKRVSLSVILAWFGLALPAIM